MSVMEMSHRGKAFVSIYDKAEADLRALLSIPDNYKVLFMQGGASTQFAAVPYNLAGSGDVADYVVTGAWSKKALGEGKRYLAANAAAVGDNKSVPAPAEWKLSQGAKYVHYCANETIGGVEFKVPGALSFVDPACMPGWGGVHLGESHHAYFPGEGGGGDIPSLHAEPPLVHAGVAGHGPSNPCSPTRTHPLH